MTRLVLIISISLIAAAAPAQAYNYFPLDPDGPNSDHWYVQTEDPQVTCHRYTAGESDEYFIHVQEYWNGDTVNEFPFVRYMQVDSQDDVWLSWEYVYRMYFATFNPPCMLIDAPLYVGKTWNWESGNNDEEYIEFTCLAEEDIELCGDTYHAFHVYGIGQKMAEVGWDYFMITWRYSAWHCDGFGIVRYDYPNGHVYELDCQVSNEATTWSEVKALYR